MYCLCFILLNRPQPYVCSIHIIYDCFLYGGTVVLCSVQKRLCCRLLQEPWVLLVAVSCVQSVCVCVWY